MSKLAVQFVDDEVNPIFGAISPKEAQAGING
ncbi:hypothetical protein CDAR_221761, partial [Caerostris darwini]